MDKYIEQAAQIILPAERTRTWGQRNRAAVVIGIRAGLITRKESFDRYGLSAEELETWERAFDQGGEKALSLKAMRHLFRGRRPQASADP